MNRDSLLENPLWKPPSLAVLVGPKQLHDERKRDRENMSISGTTDSFFSQNKNKTRSVLEMRGREQFLAKLFVSCLLCSCYSMKRNRIDDGLKDTSPISALGVLVRTPRRVAEVEMKFFCPYPKALAPINPSV